MDIHFTLITFLERSATATIQLPVTDEPTNAITHTHERS